MATARIGNRLLSSIQPAGKDAFFWDDEVSGFGLKVTPSGSKVYVYDFRLGGARLLEAAYHHRQTWGAHSGLGPGRG